MYAATRIHNPSLTGSAIVDSLVHMKRHHLELMLWRLVALVREISMMSVLEVWNELKNFDEKCPSDLLRLALEEAFSPFGEVPKNSNKSRVRLLSLPKQWLGQARTKRQTYPRAR